MMWINRLSASPLAIGVFLACADGNGDTSYTNAVQHSERDSVGIRIVESPTDVLETSLPWVIDSVPSLELGEIAGDAAMLFDGISGIVGLPNGMIVVVDAGSSEVRWFTENGDHVHTLGNRGDGPGEFRDPLLVPQFRTDSLLIFDRRRRAFTRIASDGSGVRTLPGGRPVFGGTPTVADGTKALFTSAAGRIGSCPENAECATPILLRWVDVNGTEADTVGAGGRLLTLSVGAGPSVILMAPLDPKGLSAAGQDGLVIEGSPHFELRQLDADGQIAAIFRVDAAPPRTPEDAMAEYLEQFPDPDEAKRMFASMTLPEEIPAFQELQVDHSGWLWAELFRPTMSGVSEWLVFDPQGRAHGMLTLPPGLEVHDIGEDYILGLWVDELGVERVRRYALTRGGT